jgi:hypothetical protein
LEPEFPDRVGARQEERRWPKKAKKGNLGRKQDRARVAGKQNYEVGYEAKKMGTSRKKVRQARKRAGPSRKKVERALRG